MPHRKIQMMTRWAAASVALSPATFALALSPLYLGPGDPAGAAGAHYVFNNDQFIHSGVSNSGIAIATLDQALNANIVGQATLIWTPTLAPTALVVPGGDASTTLTPSINARGGVVIDAVTSSSNPSTERAYRFAALATSGTALDQSPGSTPAGTYNRAAVNLSDSGYALGWSSTRLNGVDTGNRAVVWAPGSTTPIALQQLSMPEGVAISTARFMNDNGVIAGTATKYFQFAPGFPAGAKGTRPVRWASTSATPVELSPINATTSGFSEGAVLGLSPSGMAVGQTHKYQGDVDLGSRPVRWAAGGTAVTELSTFTDPTEHFEGQVTAINASNVSVGYAKDLALRWDANGTPSILAPLPLNGATKTARAVSINALGTAVGTSATAFSTAATIWLPGSTSAQYVEGYPSLPARTHLIAAMSVSDTGFVSGIATYDPQNTGTPYAKYYTILIPQAGTYGRGDGNFDTRVNFDDLIILAQHYNAQNPLRAIDVGDFNLDGQTNFDDLIVLAQNYNTTPGAALTIGDAAFAADWALAQSLVPEPASCVALAALALLRRQQR